jgi:hypothetical protein
MVARPSAQDRRWDMSHEEAVSNDSGKEIVKLLRGWTRLGGSRLVV